MQPKKKQSLKQTWHSAIYAIKTVLRINPKLFGLGIVDEAITRTIPFVEAYLFARIVTLLPQFVEQSTREAALQSVVAALAGVVVLRIINALVRSLFRLYQEKSIIDLDAQIEKGLLHKFSHLPYAKYEEKELMDQYDLARHYSARISNFVLYRLRSLMGSVYAAIVAAGVLINFSPFLALMFVVLTIPEFLLETKVNRKQRENWRDTTVVRRKSSTFSDLFNATTIKDSRLFGLIEYALDKFFTYNKRAQEEQLEIERSVEKYRMGVQVANAIAEVGALAYVVTYIYRGLQPIGQFVYVQQVLGQYSTAVRDIMWYVEDLDEFLAGAHEYHTFMKLPETAAGAQNIDAKHDITLENVSFTYPGTKDASLRNVSLSIPYGKTIAIVGENGAGKTTLIKLLLKLYEPSSGTIRMGSQQLHHLDEAVWHDHLGVLFQDFVSFNNFTIRENVHFGRLTNKADDESVSTALKKAGAYDFVKSLPKGLDTYLGKYMDEENGTLLSGGQLQRLAIARVLFRDPDILIMDEPTSAVDAKAEFQIFQEIEAARKDRTTILISHRFSTVRKADYIFVLDKGRLIEQGTHDELLEQNGQYSELFNAQASGYR